MSAETTATVNGNSSGKRLGSTAGTMAATGNVRVLSKDTPKNPLPAEKLPNSGQATLALEQQIEVIKPVLPHEVAIASTTVIQLFEGAVLDIDQAEGVMRASLKAKFGTFAEHVAVIDLAQVHDQDQDLLKPGAVFYLTLFRKNLRGALQNFQEIRFRRSPTWSPKQVEKIWSMADALAANLAPPNVVGD